MKDSSENKRDLKEGKGAEVKDGVLNLGDEEVMSQLRSSSLETAMLFPLILN